MDSANNLVKNITKTKNKIFNWIKKQTVKVVDRVKDVRKDLKNFINKNTSEQKQKPTSDESVKKEESINQKENEEDFNPKEYESAIKGNYISYRIEGNKKNDEKVFLHKIKPKVINLIKDRVKSQRSLKTKFIFSCNFKREKFGTKEFEYCDGNFPSVKSEIVLEATDLSELFDRLTNEQLRLFEEFLHNKSGWIFDHVLFFDIFIDRFVPLLGGSYIQLPPELANRNALINPKNENDHECFKWCVTEAVYPRKKNRQRVNKELIENSKNFNWSGINFPASLQDITNFEDQNDYDIAIFGYDKNVGVYPIKRSRKRGFELIRLLLITDEETYKEKDEEKDEETNKHYCLINDISRLISKQVTKRKCKMFFCDNCLHSFHLKRTLEKHEGYCYLYNEARIDMLKDKDGKPCFISFKNFVEKNENTFSCIC